MLSQLLLITICVISTLSCYGQIDYNSSIPVIELGDTLENPWAGGLNHVQISDFDVDLDGDLDLFIFDISSNNIRVLTQELINGIPSYKFLYSAAELFPSDIIYKGVMIDYDNDGRKDLWTSGISGLKVYRNVSDQVNGLQWQLQEDLIYSQYASNYSPLLVSLSDMPAITDVDFDGDIDILTFHSGGEVVEYHQNQSMELYGIPDSLIFEQKNECWGLFRESSLNNSLTLNDQSFPCMGGNIPNPQRIGNASPSIELTQKVHAGSSLLAIDLDNSGVVDLILGDSFYPGLVSLINGGSIPNSNSAMSSQDVTFPSYNVPAELDLFPVSFYVDVDFDQVKDLVVGSNVNNLAENESSVLFYKNIGTNASPNFSFQQKNLFQSEMIEHGSGSIPVLFDEDEDGLKDLVVGNFYRYKPYLEKESTIALYRNTGTATSPEFTYLDFDYLNLSQESFGLRLSPTFGDIDGDGDEDMYMGRTNGSLIFFENNSTGSGANFSIAVTDLQDDLGNTIDVGDYSFPQLFDLNKDSLIDLVIGNRTGEIFYYENIGTNSVPSFHLIDSTLGQVDVSGTEINGYSSPHFFRRNDTTYLLCGAYNGKLHYFNNIDGNLAPTDAFNPITNSYGGINVDAYSTVVVNDIDNDGNLNVFVGQQLGGIYHFNESNVSNIGLGELNKSPNVILYPNPSSSTISLESEQENIQSIQVINMFGQIEREIDVNDDKIIIDVRILTKGSYLIKVVLENESILMKRFVRI